MSDSGGQQKYTDTHRKPTGEEWVRDLTAMRDLEEQLKEARSNFLNNYSLGHMSGRTRLLYSGVVVQAAHNSIADLFNHFVLDSGGWISDGLEDPYTTWEDMEATKLLVTATTVLSSITESIHKMVHESNDAMGQVLRMVEGMRGQGFHVMSVEEFTKMMDDRVTEAEAEAAAASEASPDAEPPAQPESA